MVSPLNMPKPPVHNSTRQYVADPTIARGYDRYFANQSLFEYDSAVLTGWFGRPGRLIDFGCGTGRHVIQFARRGFDVVGVDLSQAMLTETSAKLDRLGLPARLVQADICNLPKDDTLDGPFAEGRYAYALCMFSTLGLIYGSENRLSFLRDIRRLLLPDGELALHLHNRWFNLWRHEGRVFLIGNWLRSLLGKAERGDKFLSSYRGIRGMYIHVFSENEIRHLLEQAGFEIVELVPLNIQRTGPLRPRWLRHILANGFLVRARQR